MEPEQIVAVLEAAELIEAEHRGLTWDDVGRIRASNASALALAREYGVSDTLIRKVRRGELWKNRAEPRNRNDVPRRVIAETLILAGPRVSELCGLLTAHVDLAGGRLRIPRAATKTDAGERIVPLLPSSTSTSPTTGSTTRVARTLPRSLHATALPSTRTTSEGGSWAAPHSGPTSSSKPRAGS